MEPDKLISVMICKITKIIRQGKYSGKNYLMTEVRDKENKKLTLNLFEDIVNLKKVSVNTIYKITNILTEKYPILK